MPPIWNKVPQITAAFWAIKIMSTTVGETLADCLAVNAGLGEAVTMAVTFACLVSALTFQLRAHECQPVRYWLVVVLLGVMGTQVTDLLTDGLDVNLYWCTAAFAVALAIVLATWNLVEGSLSITAIDSCTREWFYWAAILFTFALGTASGDLATEELGLGLQLGVLVFAGLMAITAIGARFGANRTMAFWIAYVLSRPLGASLGDLLSQSSEYGGLGLGALSTSAMFLVAIVALVTRAQLHARGAPPLRLRRVSRRSP